MDRGKSRRGDSPDALGNFIVAAWGGFVAVLAFLALTHAALFSSNWCAGSTSCLRDWASALSGWAAAGVAGVTVFVLVSTLRQMQYGAEIQNQAYVHASRGEFGAYNNVLIYCKNSGLTPATHFALNGQAMLVVRGAVTSSIAFRNDDFKIWSALGSHDELSVSVEVDPEIVRGFRERKCGAEDQLLICGQIIYCTVDNHDHVTQFAFYVDSSDRKKFRRPTSNLKSFWRIPPEGLV